MRPEQGAGIVESTAMPNLEEHEMFSIPEMYLPPAEPADIDPGVGDEELVNAWRVEQLSRLGLPLALAEAFAATVDWHELTALVERGCSPDLALEIVR